MEDQLRDVRSKTLEKSSVLDVIAKLEEVAASAAEIRDMADVKDADLQRALSVVEDFLRDKRLIAYGGTAINAHIPAKHKFYDFSVVLPDYDFFSPTAEVHARELVDLLERAGLPDPALRPGMHEGTFKVYVKYTAVADCSQIEPWIFKKLQGRAHVVQGIYYADANFLRMQMYLELSRPRGEVERWAKVYKRLLLLNTFAPYKCKKTGPLKTRVRGQREGRGRTIVCPYYDECMDYVIDEGLIYAGSNVRRLYERPARRQLTAFGRDRVPCIAYAADPEHHARMLEKILRKARDRPFKLVRWAGRGDLVPALVGLKDGDRIVALFVELGGCLSYNTLKMGRQALRIASLDTAIYLYFALMFVGGVDSLVERSFMCAAEDLVHIALKTRDRGFEGVYDAFPVTCMGHQARKASLIREKVERIRKHRRHRTVKRG
jgi:hypothetical protein